MEPGCDDAVKLPAGSIGADELSIVIPAGATFVLDGNSRTLNIPKAGLLLVKASGMMPYSGGRPAPTIRMDGVVFGSTISMLSGSGPGNWWNYCGQVNITAGTHTISSDGWPGCFIVLLVQDGL